MRSATIITTAQGTSLDMAVGSPAMLSKYIIDDLELISDENHKT